MAQYKYKEKNNIVSVIDGDEIIAQYEVDKHWTEKNLSVKGDKIHIRLYNRMKGFIDSVVELNNNAIQKIPNEKK